MEWVYNFFVELYILINVLCLFVVCLKIDKRGKKYCVNVTRFIYPFACLILLCALILLYKIKPSVDILDCLSSISNDALSYFAKFWTLSTSLACFLFMWTYCREGNIRKYEFIFLFFFAIIGLLIIASSSSTAIMYLGIELQSLCFYILATLKFNSNISIEAGVKYFLVGITSSAMLLFGISMLYGITGVVAFQELEMLFNSNLIYSKIKPNLMGFFLIYCGIFFKLGIVPFHMWVADIYEGAPIHVTFFFSVVPQVGFISLILRLNNIFIDIFYNEISMIFLILSILSIFVGTLGAIYQTKLRRILAFSSISHMGYILSMLLITDIAGMFFVIFYIVIYTVISLGLWSFILHFRNNSNRIEFKDMDNIALLYKSNKYISIFFFIFLFSVMGVPPLLGFFSKFFVLLNVVELEMYFFAIFLIIINSISVFYYLRLIKKMFSSNMDKSLFLSNMSVWLAFYYIVLIILNVSFFLYPSIFCIIIKKIVLFFFK